MYLKSLTLKGFKSFADRSQLVFEPGLTVVVGPNGSGKSNVSDAVLWVLGEQSAKQLRGQAMEDVVFAGSSARKAAGLAEVVLVLDNADRTLPVDFDEVAITRRMYRSGESEYLINGAPARLLDVTDILHDSGLGKDMRSVIGQGKLDAILTSRPEERRALVEEAAGISKHKRRREKAVKRLESMDARMRRALDVQREVARQLRPLERQVEKARRANELTERASALRVGIAEDDLRRLKARWEELEAQEVEQSARVEAAAAGLAAAQAALAALERERAEQQVGHDAAAARRARSQSAAERLEGLERLLAQKARGLADQEEGQRAACEAAAARRDDAAGELVEARAALQANRAEVADLRARMDAANAAVRAARGGRRAAEDELSGVQGRAKAAGRDRDAASVALAKAQDALENAQEQDDLYAARIDQVREGEVRSTGELERARADAAAAEGARAVAEEAVAAARAAQDEARAELRRRQAAESDARRALARAETRVETLAAAATADENAAPLAATLARGAAGTRVRVSEVLEVPAELTGLVERLLDQALAGFVARDGQDLAALAAAAEEAAEKSAGQVALVGATDADRRGAATLPGFALADRVGARAGYEGVLATLLGDVRVVPSAREAALAAAGDPAHRYVTPQGTAVFRGPGALVGSAGDAHAGLLERRRQLRDERAALPALQKAVDEAAAAAAAADAAAAEAAAALDARTRERARAAGEASALAAAVERAEEALATAAAELADLEGRRAQAAARAHEAGEAAHAAALALNDAEGRLTDLEGMVSDLGHAFEEARRAERAAHDEANACQLELARAGERTSGLESRAARLERQAAEAAVAADEAAAARDLARVRAGRAAPVLAAVRALLAQARDLAAGLSEAAGRSDLAAADLRARLDAARDAERAAHAEQGAALAAVGDVKVEKGRLDVQVDAAVRAIGSQPGVVLEEALSLPPLADRAADERELARVEGQLAQIGPVNQVAFQEYEELSRRHDHIAAQVADLQHARSDITKILAAIDRKMRASFLDAFDAVNRNFQQIFATLFPGGEGHLELTDPDDPASTGVEVVAQPRGKRVTKMSLLSGGERSLTALGLLFAAYRTRSVPFYVLDEVEAALDDSNLDRLLAALEVLRKSTQLIVISHQRRTMEAADVLYGVSMRSDGVSHVVSQRLDRTAS